MDQDKIGHFSTDEKDALIRLVHKAIRLSVKSLAVLSTLVIVWSIMDVVWVMYRRLSQPPILVLSPNDILFMRTPQNTPPFMAGMNAGRG